MRIMTTYSGIPSEEFWALYDKHSCNASPDDGCEVCDEAGGREQQEPRKCEYCSKPTDECICPVNTALLADILNQNDQE